VSKGLAAQGALLAVTRKTKTFSLESANKLFESVIQSTTLYADGIWGLESVEILERVQQQFFKKVLRLPNCTPKYFIRLETGRSHLSHETLKLALSVFNRILTSPPDSILYQSFIVLKRVSLLIPESKYSWCLQLREALAIVKEEAIIDI
jgi:hypothetical protein